MEKAERIHPRHACGEHNVGGRVDNVECLASPLEYQKITAPCMEDHSVGFIPFSLSLAI